MVEASWASETSWGMFMTQILLRQVSRSILSISVVLWINSLTSKRLFLKTNFEFKTLSRFFLEGRDRIQYPLILETLLLREDP